MRIRGSKGFTLIEMIIVIVITGIIASTVAIFIKPAIDSYTASVHRAELTDAVDTALRRLSRDVRTAVPNSLRQHSNTCIEYAPIRAAGRYRRERNVAGDDELSFSAADNQFDVLNMTPAGTVPAPGDQVVIYNLGQDVADLYAAGNNRGAVAAGSTAALVQLSPSKLFPLASPNASFQLVPASGPVALVCTGVGTVAGSGSGRLVARTGQGYVAATGTCPAVVAGTTTDTILVDRVSACSFNYNSDVLRRHGLLTVSLSLMRDGETVNLVQQIHIDNVP